MARGGGTGSRNKQKKKSETTTQNGTSNGPETEIKLKQTTKHRKQKDETPPPGLVEEEVIKEEKPNKLQPTSEQLRLAHLTQDTTLDPQRKGKINQVMDFTGKTEDEVATALFDCGWDVQKAIELLLEEGGGLGSWEETGKKKKKKQEKEDKEGKENEDWDTDNFDPTGRHDGDNRDKSRGRGPPRFKRGGGSAGGGGRQDDIWKNKEWQENEKNFEGGRGRGGGRGAGRGSRGGMAPRQRGRGGGPRQFGAGGDRGIGGGVDRNAGVGGAPPDAGPFGQIDTWNPVGEETSRRGKMSNRDAFDNAGNWGDDFPTAEDWDNDEYTGSLSDTKVFTPSGTTGKSAVGEPVNAASVAAAQATQPSPANNSLSGASYGQQIDLSSLLPKPGVTPGGPSAAPGGPTGTSLTQYNQTATQDLKTAIGIGGPSTAGSIGIGGSATASKVGDLGGSSYASSALSYSSGGSSQFSANSSGGGTSNFASAAPGSAFSPIKPAAVTNGNSGSKALPRARIPPPSKIPSSAVEMPGDSLSNLDVQFGGLDLQFGANSDASNAGGGGGGGGGGGSAAASSSSGFDFTAGSTDLDSKYSIPVSSTDKDSSYKPVPASVKDVNQSLNNALSAAGIKPSGSTDSVGYQSQQRSESKSNSNYVPQRSPGPQTLDRSKPPAVTDSLGGYNSSGYPYQTSSSQSSKTSNQFGHPNNSYPSTNSYERQNSSGYSSTNGLSSSYGGNSGSSSSYNSSNATPSNNYSSTSNSNSYNSGYVSTASSYSSYSGSNNYNSKSSANSTSYTTTSQSQFPTSEPSTTSSSGTKFDTSVTGSGYPTNNFGLTSSVSSKMSVNSTGSSKMLPNIPPGVASMIPQYMIGAGTGAGFPTYLTAAGLQQPMYGYGGVGGVSGQQLEDLAALQRSTLASLPQLVGSAGQATNNKGPSTAGYYDPSSQFGTASSISTTRADANSFSDSNKFGGTGSGVTDSTSSPVPSTVATGQPTPFNALASTFAAAPTQHPTLPPGYAYFYGGMAPQLQAAAYGQTGVYPTAHPGIVPTAAGATSTTQFQKQGYGSSSDYGKSNFATQAGQGKGSNSSTAGHWFGGGNLW